MIPDSFPPGIRIKAGPELRLRSGDLISLQVIKRIYGNKWAVGLQGRVIPAYSDLDLIPGKTLRVLVNRVGDRYVLKLTDPGVNPIHELLLREGLSSNKVSEQIVASLLRTGIGVKAQIVQQVQKLLDRMKLNPRRFSRLIALLLDKKLDISSPVIEKLIHLLGYGEGNSEKQDRRYKKRRMPEKISGIAEELKKSIIESNTDEENTLQLFNHLRGSQETWIIIPYNFSYPEEDHLYGTIRIQYDPFQEKPGRFILIVKQKKGEIWSFILSTRKRLNIFCNRKQGIKRGRKDLKLLQAKLQNLGVEIDDTIREDAAFDGFSLPWEGISYTRVDTER